MANQTRLAQPNTLVRAGRAARRAEVARLQALRLGLDPAEWVRGDTLDADAGGELAVRHPLHTRRSRLTDAEMRRLARDILALATSDLADSGAATGADPDDLELEPGTPTQAVGVDEALQNTGLDDGLATEPEHRGPQAVRLLRKIVKQNPDAALALSTVKRLAATDWTLRVYEIGPDGPTDIEHDEAAGDARRFLARVMRSHEGGGVPAMLSVGLDSLVTDGAVAFELDVAPSLDDVRDVVPVDPTVVRWQTFTTPDGQRTLRPVYKPPTGEPRPFNLHQFCYSGLDTTVTDPHGRPWILPVLDTAPAQEKLRNTLHKVMVHQGYGRLAASVNYEKVMESVPATARTPDQKSAYMRRSLADITERLKNLKVDDAVALWDFIELGCLERRVPVAYGGVCVGCLDEAELGRVKLGTLLPIGGHECRANDRCRKEYRYSAKEPVKPKRSDDGTGAGRAGRARMTGRLGVGAGECWSNLELTRHPHRRMISPMLRLNKRLAAAGIASRRGADALIAAGRITVNGQVVTDLGRQVDADDDVRLDGEPIPRPRARHRYLALYKPRDVITTVSDPEGRPTVMDFVPRDVRLYPVGRLDGASEGLVIMTDDGDLAHRLAHPRFELGKEYRVKVSGTPRPETLDAWRDGMWLEGRKTAPAEVRIERTTGAGTWLRWVLREGRNRQIRRMIEPFHHRVHRLVRVRIGPVTLGDLKPGAWRELTATEVAALHGDAAAAAELEPKSPRGTKPKYKPGWARPKPRTERTSSRARRPAGATRGGRSGGRKPPGQGGHSGGAAQAPSGKGGSGKGGAGKGGSGRPRPTAQPQRPPKAGPKPRPKPRPSGGKPGGQPRG